MTRTGRWIRLGVAVLVLATISALLAWGMDALAVQARGNPHLPAAVRIAAARLQAGVRSGVPMALAWGFGAGPLAGTAAGLTAGGAAAYAPRLSEVLIDRAGEAHGGMRGLLGLGSALVFLIAPTAGALVGGVATGVRGVRPRRQRWGLPEGAFTIGFAGALALSLSWGSVGSWRVDSATEPMGALVVDGLVGLMGGVAGASGQRVGELMWRVKPRRGERNAGDG